MRDEHMRERAVPLLSGAALVAAGATLALWLPDGLVVALALFVLLRICWLEENIRCDLIRAPELPDAYRRTQVVQQRWQIWLLGAASKPVTCPQRLASIMRMQAHTLYALFLGGAAAFLAKGTANPVAGLAVGAAILTLACLRINRLAVAETIVARGDVLPEAMLEDRGPIARFVLNR